MTGLSCAAPAGSMPLQHRSNQEGGHGPAACCALCPGSVACVQVHSPGFVDTKMFVQPNGALTGAFTKTPDAFTKRAVRHIGFEDVAVPCIPHAIMTCAFPCALD